MTKAKQGILAYWMQYEGNPWWENLKTHTKEMYGCSIYALFRKAKTNVMVNFTHWFKEQNSISVLEDVYDFVDYLGEGGQE